MEDEQCQGLGNGWGVPFALWGDFWDEPHSSSTAALWIFRVYCFIPTPALCGACSGLGGARRNFSFSRLRSIGFLCHTDPTVPMLIFQLLPAHPRSSSRGITPGHPGRAKARPAPLLSAGILQNPRCPRIPRHSLPSPESTDGPFVPVSAPVFQRLLKPFLFFPQSR